MDRAVDAAVIGGGPAGLSAAITLRRRGFRVVVLEAKSYPRHKLCGEFLSPECTSLLAELGAEELVSECQPAVIRSVRLTAPGGAVWQSELPGKASGISRFVLDAALAERASAMGVELRADTPVEQAAGSLEDGFVVEAGRARVRARAVIGAQGKRSRLDRSLRRDFIDRRSPFLALKAHVEGPPTGEEIELHGFPGGYCGISSIEGGGQNVCLLVREEMFRKHAGPGPEAVSGFLVWMQAQNQALRERLSRVRPVFGGWMSISQISFERKETLVNDMPMTGDAARLIAPLAGDGIGIALESGMLAGGLVGDYLQGSRSAVELRRDYRRAFERRFGTRLRLASGLQSLMLDPGRLNLTLRLLDLLPGLGKLLIMKTRTSRPPLDRTDR